MDLQRFYYFTIWKSNLFMIDNGLLWYNCNLISVIIQVINYNNYDGFQCLIASHFDKNSFQYLKDYIQWKKLIIYLG